jgi:hypothetical protein
MVWSASFECAVLRPDNPRSVLAVRRYEKVVNTTGLDNNRVRTSFSRISVFLPVLVTSVHVDVFHSRIAYLTSGNQTKFYIDFTQVLQLR